MRDIDPYGEEKWLEESNKNYIKCDINNVVKDGDYVICVDNKWNNNRLNLTINKKYKVIVTAASHDTFIIYNDYNTMGNYPKKLFIPFLNADEYEKRKNQMELMKLKMKDIDPYGEEDWEYESIKHIYEYYNHPKRDSDELDQFKRDLDDFKKNPDKYTIPEYITPDGSRLCIINSNEYVATGVITDGKFKGFCNTFTWGELSPINIKISENDPYGEENWEEDSQLKKIIKNSG